MLVVIVKMREFKRVAKKTVAVKNEQVRLRTVHSSENRSESQLEKKNENRSLENYDEEGKFEDTEDTENSEDLGLPFDNLPIGEKPETEKQSNRRWSNIQSLMNSYNMNDWKQAIIESDTILEEMLDKMGYKGQSIGDRLKQVEKSDFTTLNHAWEAHKVRNRIAHSGSNFTLSKDEAERVIDMYREVFSEFFYI